MCVCVYFIIIYKICFSKLHTLYKISFTNNSQQHVLEYAITTSQPISAHLLFIRCHLSPYVPLHSHSTSSARLRYEPCRFFPRLASTCQRAPRIDCRPNHPTHTTMMITHHQIFFFVVFPNLIN